MSTAARRSAASLMGVDQNALGVLVLRPAHHARVAVSETHGSADPENLDGLVELFAHLKRNLGLRRLRLRGLTGAKDEFLLAATVQNLKKLVRLCANGPPMTTKCAV